MTGAAPAGGETVTDTADGVFEQAGYRCRLEWGRRGARRAAARGDALVVVDTLRFSTAVATATRFGATIYPCSPEDDAATLARRAGAELAGSGRERERRRFSLSPLSFVDVEPGTKVVLPSPNGATCSRYGRAVPRLFVGALVNAGAVGAAVSRLLATTDLAVTVLACGERWPEASEDGPLRFAVEDELGAGAILSHLDGPLSPEARLARGAYLAARGDIRDLLWECGSGRELRHKGLGEDVRHAARLDLYEAVPVMQGECLARLG